MPRKDPYASAFGVVYSAYMARPRLSRAIGRAVWGGDAKRYYDSMSAVAEVAEGGTIVDCPCGAGPAFPAVQAGKPIRYVAVDLSPSMLRRARRRAERLGLGEVELAEADATDIPLADGCADLFLSYWGLHCFDDPPAALDEAARVLRPGGRLIGAALLRGREGLRQRLLIRPGFGDFGQPGTRSEVEEWLDSAGFELASVERSGPMLFFDARRAAAVSSASTA